MVHLTFGRAIRYAEAPKRPRAPHRAGRSRTGQRDETSRDRGASSTWWPIPYLTFALLLALAAAFFLPATKRDGTVPGEEGANAQSARVAGAAEAGASQEAARPAGPGDTGSLAATGKALAPIAAWMRLDSPVSRFTLGTKTLGTAEKRYEAGLHTTGGGRDDVVSSGTFAGAGPLLRLSVYRPGSEALPAPGFFIDLVRRAGEAGLAVRKAAVPSPLATRFASVEASDALLASGGRERACLAFRLLTADPALRLSGWLCGKEGVAPDRAELSCLLDSLQWSTAASDENAVLAFFNAAAARPEAPGCAPQKAPAETIAPTPGAARAPIQKRRKDR